MVQRRHFYFWRVKNFTCLKVVTGVKKSTETPEAKHSLLQQEVMGKTSESLLQYIELEMETFFGGGEQVFDGVLCASAFGNKDFHLLYCGRRDMAKTILSGFVEMVPNV